MPFEIGIIAHDDMNALRALVHHASLALEFETLQGPSGIEDARVDPFGSPDWWWLARVNGEAAGFAMALVLPGREGPFAIVRLGVSDGYRRQGIGRRLLETAVASVRRSPRPCGEVCISAFQPNEAATGFAETVGYAHARYFWMMERKSAPVPDVAWPQGIGVRTFDGSDRDLEAWNDIYNDSFAEHWHSVRSTVAEGRAIAARKTFDASGLLLAFREGRCVGFCRNDIHEGRGEIGVLGVSKSARGIGLGRALLRWGIAWLESRDLPVTLFVDGENESALHLYRSEGFEKARTRQIWSRTLV